MNAVIYARYSSDNQREESIDAQVRAIKKYAQHHSMKIIHIYTDEAKTATTDMRPGFQQMMKDAEDGRFSGVLVHKLDRFARNRYDSAFYKRHLKVNGVKVYSVLENIDDSPESIILESLLEGMAEYYSLNLAREVMKGLSETAYQCKHTGGTPPLGYDLAPDKTYELNHFEAEAVQIIFSMYLEGHGYGAIIDRLNERGHKTKLGRAFGKNSIHDILKNEKYSGVFVFNKTQRKVEGKRNGHLQKPEEEIIRVPGGCPAIVTPEMFERVKRKMEENKHRTGQYKSKRVYILSGLVLCGKCGSAMVGKHSRSGRNKTDYSYYECNSRRNKRTCDAKPISKPFVEDLVIDFLYENLFSDDAIGPASDKIYEDIQKSSQQVPDEVKQFEEQLKEVDAKVESMIQSVMDGMYHPSMKIKMKELEEKQIALQRRLDEAAKVDRNLSFTRDQIYHFLSLYQDIKNFSDLKKKNAVNLFVDHVIVNEDDVHLSVVTRPDAKGPLKKAKTTGGISGSSWDLLVETIRAMTNPNSEPVVFDGIMNAVISITSYRHK